MMQMDWFICLQSIRCRIVTSDIISFIGILWAAVVAVLGENTIPLLYVPSLLQDAHLPIYLNNASLLIHS